MFLQRIDLNVQSNFDVLSGNLLVDFRHNYNQMDVSSVKANTINNGRVFDLENQVPEHNSVVSFTYSQDQYSALVRLNRYGEWSSTGGLFGPGDASDAHKYSGTMLVDVEFKMDVTDQVTLAIGGENIFDEYPDKENNGTLNYLGQQHAVTSPFGFNGAFWYVRGSMSF